jgi:hypothetical protein
VDRNQLQAGNAMIQGTAQLSLFVGPVVAGLLVSWLDGGAAHSTSGIALAIAIDSLSFLASVTALSLIRIENADARAGNGKGGVLASIREGLLYVWNEPTLRMVFPITLGLNILINGPFAVGIPVMARTRFPEGAAAFGLILSLFGGGALLGTTLAGVLPKPSRKWLGTISLSVISLMGVGLAVIGVSPTMYVAAAAGLLMGIANGYANIILITWLQQKVAPEMIGRVMSLVMFAAIGLNPISNALAGMLIGLNITVLLVCAGLLMTTFTLSAAFSPAVRAGME